MANGIQRTTAFPIEATIHRDPAVSGNTFLQDGACFQLKGFVHARRFCDRIPCAMTSPATAIPASMGKTPAVRGADDLAPCREAPVPGCPHCTRRACASGTDVRDGIACGTEPASLLHAGATTDWLYSRSGREAVPSQASLRENPLQDQDRPRSLSMTIAFPQNLNTGSGDTPAPECPAGIRRQAPASTEEGSPRPSSEEDGLSFREALRQAKRIRRMQIRQFGRASKHLDRLLELTVRSIPAESPFHVRAISSNNDNFINTLFWQYNS